MPTLFNTPVLPESRITFFEYCLLVSGSPLTQFIGLFYIAVGFRYPQGFTVPPTIDRTDHSRGPHVPVVFRVTHFLLLFPTGP